jgi:HEXXH motif-containing protein
VNDVVLAGRGFACPYEPFDEEFLAAITVVHTRELMRRFLGRFGEPLRARSDGLVPTLERWLSEDATFDDVWDTAFGRLRFCLHFPTQVDVVRAAATAALRIAERSGRADWEARFERPARILIGRNLLPAADRIGVTAGGGCIEMRVSRGGRTETVTLPRPMPSDASAATCDVLASTDVEGARFLILTKEAWEAGEFGEDAIADPDPDSILPHLETMLRLVARESPLYFDWIRRVVRRILPLPDDPRVMTSSTDPWRPGVLYSANRPNPAALAEMWIHEGSHQYMYVLTRLGPLEDGSDPNLYYSPVSRRMRPLGVIVLAYHAVANITLFCRSCPPGSRLRPRETEKTFVEALAAFEKILLRSQAVTAAGRALWEPLYERLHARGDGPISAARSPGKARKGAFGSYRNTTARRPTAR